MSGGRCAVGRSVSPKFVGGCCARGDLVLIFDGRWLYGVVGFGGLSYVGTVYGCIRFGFPVCR